MQRSLFDLAGGFAPEERVGAAAVPGEVLEWSRKLPSGLRLGTSSWSFPGWRGIVWDRKVAGTVLARYGLAVYARHPLFRAVGIDRTYYAPLGPDDFAAHAAAVPDAFRFVVKAASACTDPVRRRSGPGRRGEPNPLFLDSTWAVDAVVRPFVEGLGAKGGALVFQFPPQPRASLREPARFAESLARFLEGLPRGPIYAVEVRDAPLLCAALCAALRAGGAVACRSLHPRLPSLAEQERLVPSAAGEPWIVRWMLHREMTFEEARRRYSPFGRIVDADHASRSDLAARCRAVSGEGREAYVIANNKAEGCAPLSLAGLAEAIAALG